MRNLDIMRRAARSLRTAKARTLLTALAIAVGAFALTLTMASSNGARQYANTIISDNFNPAALIVTNDESFFRNTNSTQPQQYNANYGSITSQSGSNQQVKMLTDADLARLSAVPGVASVQPNISLNLQYITRDGQRKYVATAVAYDSYNQPALAAGSIPDHIPNGSVILPQAFVSSLGFSSAQAAIGQTIRVAVQKQSGQASLMQALAAATSGNANKSSVEEQQFKIIAVATKPSTLIMPETSLYLKINEHDLTTLNDFATMGTVSYHKYLTANVDVTNGQDTQQLNTVEARVKQLGYTSQSVVDTEKSLTQVLNVLQGIVMVFGLIAIIASLFGVVNTMYISVLQRTREIGLMKALGMRRWHISKLFLYEASLIGLIGGLIGAGLAAATGALLNPVITKKLSLNGQHLLIFHPIQIIVLVIVLAIIATIAGILPARKAAKLDPIEALRVE